MAIFTKELLHLNRKMQIVLLVVFLATVVSVFFLWRYMELKSLVWSLRVWARMPPTKPR